MVAHAVTPEGLPVKSWVFPGNTADVSTVERVRSDLRGWNLNRAIFVADSAMNSRNNREELARACGKYLLATRMASINEVKHEVLGKRGRYHVIRDNLHAKEIIIGDGERRRRYVLCYSPKEAERQKRRRAESVRFLEQELARHPKPKATARWAIDLLASLRRSDTCSNTPVFRSYYKFPIIKCFRRFVNLLVPNPSLRRINLEQFFLDSLEDSSGFRIEVIHSSRFCFFRLPRTKLL